MRGISVLNEFIIENKVTLKIMPIDVKLKSTSIDVQYIEKI